ncbi:MAG: hydrogenase maturation protease [Neisseriales bacterium]|nr:MAG: hydrogenase maturation protease [Neisseriales bacterium]
MIKTLILGIGSPFGDDRAGWLVVEELEQVPAVREMVAKNLLTLEVADRPGINLINWLLSDYQKIILIDMVKTNLEIPGSIYKLQASKIIGFSGMLSSHSLGVSASLALAKELGINIANVEFWGVEGSVALPESEVSQAILTGVSQVSQKILADPELHL